ncbi:hypothetical protein BaRGS_00028017, partial [Batillaria attramentaria]
NLFLTLYDETQSDGTTLKACYFSHVDNSLAHHFDNYKATLEKQIREVVTPVAQDANRLTDQERVHQTTLSEMRDKYRDRLADFHCMDRAIFTLDLDYFACDFDDGLCTWTQSQTDDLDWTLHRGPTLTSRTGPQSDHTTHTGDQGDTAVLMSPYINLTTPMCVRFWYYMYGSGMGSLQVLKIKGADYIHRQHTDLYHVEGNKGQSWRQGEVTFHPSSDSGERLRIGFRAVRGSSVYSDIAVDDVTGTPGVCPSERIDCDFGERGFCEWHQDDTESMDWRLHSGATETQNTGPNSDHTNTIHQPGVKNQYAYMEANDGRPSDEANLLSPVLDLEVPLCMTFWYFMKGGDVGTLSVYTKNLDTDEEKVLWSRSGPQLDDWNEGRVTVLPLPDNAPMQIVIQSRRGITIHSDIAIDDITGAPGVCQSTHLIG